MKITAAGAPGTWFAAEPVTLTWIPGLPPRSSKMMTAHEPMAPSNSICTPRTFSVA